ncbi:MAG: M48 family metallopeptidase [Chloroflexota bacterium]
MADISSAADAEITTGFDPRRQEMAREYAAWQRGLQIAVYVVVFIVAWNIISPAASIMLRDWVSSATENTGLVVALYSLVIGAGFLLLLLPVVFASGYMLPRKYGLLTQTLPAWWRDYIRGFVLALSVWLVGLEIFYLVVRAYSDGWWLPIALLAWFAAFVRAYIYPVLLLPISFKVRPLDDPVLVERLTELARRAGIPALGMYVTEVSNRTTATNAWLMGLGKTRRIVLADTLLQNYTYDELEGILAHEMAHHVHNDVQRAVALAGVFSLVTALIAFLLMSLFSYGGGLEGPSDVAAMPYLIMAFGIGSSINSLMGNYLSRRDERAADSFAMRLTGNPDAYRSAQIKLADQNLVEARPSWFSPLARTHPSSVERVQMADVAAGRAPDAYGPVRNSSWNRRTLLFIGSTILAVVLLLGGLAAWSLSSLFSAVPSLSAYQERAALLKNAPLYAEAASWPVLLAAAQKEADGSVGRSAMLYRVFAYPHSSVENGDELRADSVLLLEMQYIRADGSGVSVMVLDTSPPTIVGVDATDGLGYAVSTEDLQRAAKLLHEVEFGPRDVFSGSLPDARAFSEQQGDEMPPFLDLDLTEQWPTDYGPTSRWHITYTGPDKELELWVDAHTGRTVQSETNPVEYDDEDVP